jgi:hypothetical protein
LNAKHASCIVHVPDAGGFPAISAVLGHFFSKDVILLAASLVLLVERSRFSTRGGEAAASVRVHA